MNDYETFSKIKTNENNHLTVQYNKKKSQEQTSTRLNIMVKEEVRQMGCKVCHFTSIYSNRQTDTCVVPLCSLPFQTKYQLMKGRAPRASHLYCCGHVRYGEDFSYDQAPTDKILCFLCLKTRQSQCQGLLMVLKLINILT